jgi:hypothetical protein
MRAAVPDAPLDLDHDALMLLALDRAPDDALRRVFDVSRRLGAGFRSYHRLDLPLVDLCDVLPRLGVACAVRTWTALPGEHARRAERAPCDSAPHHPRACELWREAIQGLVLGLTSEIHLARHRSRGAGDARCADVLHVHPQSPSRFGPIPDDVQRELERIRRTACALDPALAVAFLGISEGVLYYRAARAGVPGHQLTTSIEPAVRRRFPQLALRDVSPRPGLAAAVP